MKKLLLLFTATLAISACSGDDDNSRTNNTSFNPPTWVQGTWTYNAGGQETGLKFTSDNVCTVSNSNAICYKEALALYNGTNAQTSVKEENTASKYDVDINIAGNIVSYHIVKVSTTQINWVINSSSTLTLTKQ